MLDQDVEYFLAVAAVGSLATAAQRVGITQPALSKAIQRLERKVGVALITRSAQGSELTAAGAALQKRLRSMAKDADEALEHARDLGGGHAGLLRIGATPAATIFTLDALLPKLPHERPAARLSFTTAFSNELLTSLVQREIEVALCPLPEQIDPSLESELLFDDPYSLVVNLQHPLANQPSVSLEDLAECVWASSPLQEYARQQMEGLFAQRGLARPKVMMEVNSMPALFLAIAKTSMVGLINSRGVEPGYLPANVTLRPMLLEGIHCPVGVVWRRGHLSSIALRALQLIRLAAHGTAAPATFHP